MAPKPLKFSTGVILKDPAGFNAHVEVVNLSSSVQTVTVEFFDWDIDQLSGPPVPIPGTPAGSITIQPNTHVAFLAPIVASIVQPSLPLTHYEIQITLSSNVDVIVNCFCIDSNGKIIEGNTVLHQELIQL